MTAKETPAARLRRLWRRYYFADATKLGADEYERRAEALARAARQAGRTFAEVVSHYAAGIEQPLGRPDARRGPPPKSERFGAAHCETLACYRQACWPSAQS